MPLLDIVLPCLNESLALPWVLSRVPAGARAIVVDNGSTDASAVVAEKFGALVVPCSTRGYGAACDAGLRAAGAEYVAFADCDGTLNPGDAITLMERIQAGADLVVARRRATSRAAWSWSSRVANRELARQVSRRIGHRLPDLGPMRVARREALLDLNLADRRSGYPVETVVAAADRGWRIESADVTYHPRIGESKVTGTVRGSMVAIRDMRAVLAA